MGFSRTVKEKALFKSERYCCICKEFAGRNAEVHHIVQEADGGSNDLDNAIVLCSRCHNEAGHYNDRHPLGNKYSPNELRKHRDKLWRYCESNYDKRFRPEDADTPLDTLPDMREISVIEKEIGTLWSNYANMPAESELVRFEGRYIAETKKEESSGVTFYELYQLVNGRYIVYTEFNRRGDWCKAHLAGVNAWDEFDPPLTRTRLQNEFPILATAANLPRVREFKIEE